MLKYNNIDKIPVVVYINAQDYKFIIRKENKNKSGIYCWKNRSNNKIYVGSAVYLTRRLNEYFNTRYLNKLVLMGNSLIYNSLLKYGYSNFSLSILEYCEPNLLIKREQYYIDLLNPEYNILKTAGSMLGFKHSLETLLKFKNRKHSIETRAIIRKTKLGKAHSSLQRMNHLLSTSHITIVINIKKGSVKHYSSIREAAKDLNTVHGSLIYCMKNNTLFKNTFLILKLMKI